MCLIKILENGNLCFFLWEGFPLLLQYIHMFFSQKQADTDIDYTRKNNHRIFFNQWKGGGATGISSDHLYKYIVK